MFSPIGARSFVAMPNSQKRQGRDKSERDRSGSAGSTSAALEDGGCGERIPEFTVLLRRTCTVMGAEALASAVDRMNSEAFAARRAIPARYVVGIYLSAIAYHLLNIESSCV
jgi:hypothetical protein